MKTKLLILLISFFSITTYSQEKTKSKTIYSCQEIKKVIIDESLRKELPSGKKVLNINLHKTKIYKIIYASDKHYYVAKPMMKRIRKSIRKNKCNGIKIAKLDNLSDGKIKIIRD